MLLLLPLNAVGVVLDRCRPTAGVWGCTGDGLGGGVGCDGGTRGGGVLSSSESDSTTMKSVLLVC